LTIEARLCASKTKKVKKAEQKPDASSYCAADHVAFLRRVAGIPDDAPDDWRLPRPCIVVQDNYSVHIAKVARAAYRELEKHGLIVRQLPGYSPDLNPIECAWRWVKYRGLRHRYFPKGEGLQTAVIDACRRYRPAPSTRRRRNSGCGT